MSMVILEEFGCLSFTIVADLRRLPVPEGLVVRNVIDLSDLARINDYTPWCLDTGPITGLAALLAHYMHQFLPLKNSKNSALDVTEWPIPLTDRHILCTGLSTSFQSVLAD